MGPHASTANILLSQNPDNVGDIFILQVRGQRKIMNLFEITPELASSEAGRQGGERLLSFNISLSG